VTDQKRNGESEENSGRVIQGTTEQGRVSASGMGKNIYIGLLGPRKCTCKQKVHKRTVPSIFLLFPFVLAPVLIFL
jgi:hypothetical protein